MQAAALFASLACALVSVTSGLNALDRLSIVQVELSPQGHNLLRREEGGHEDHEVTDLVSTGSKEKQASQTSEVVKAASTARSGSFLSQPYIFAFRKLALVVVAIVVPAVVYAPGWLAALLYLATSVCIDMCVAISHVEATQKQETEHSFSFNPLCSIALVELGKLVVSSALFLANQLVQKGSPTLTSTAAPVTAKDVVMMAGPALLFTLNNVLVFLAIGNNEVATFGAFRETMILWTAVIWCWVFKVSLGWRRTLALNAVMVGLALNQVSPMMNATLSSAVLLVCVMALANACGSVCNEYVLKRRNDLDLNLQNMFLYSWCLLMAVVTLAITDPKRLTSVGEFFHGFDHITYIIGILQLFAGLLVSRILKYADSLHKNIVAALRSPVLVILAPHLGLPSRSDPLTLLSAVVVGSSSAAFLCQGKPV